MPDRKRPHLFRFDWHRQYRHRGLYVDVNSGVCGAETASSTSAAVTGPLDALVFEAAETPLARDHFGLRARVVDRSDVVSYRPESRAVRRVLLIGSGLLGATAVGLGAFGAHGLEALLADAPDLAQRIGWWHTAVAYHLPHAGMLAVCAGLCSDSSPRGRLWLCAGGFALGVLLFCGTLYAMALGAPRWFGAITPIGGLSLIGGWLALGTVGLKHTREQSR